MTLGEKIRTRRIELNMTMDDLGRAVGVQRSAINKYEKGMLTNPTRSMIQSLAKALDVSPFYLLDDDQDNPMDLTETERSIIISYRQAKEGIQDAVRKILDIE